MIHDTCSCENRFSFIILCGGWPSVYLDLFSFQTNSIKEKDEVLQDDFLIKEFQKSIGAKSIIEEQPNENNIEGIEEEFKELLNDYIKKFPEEVEWPLNLSNFKKENLTSEIPDIKDLQNYSITKHLMTCYLATKI